jgi:hypothetical protein
MIGITGNEKLSSARLPAFGLLAEMPFFIAGFGAWLGHFWTR